MGKINVLDFEIANLIAAGEVVERPSSVLKELIENSIDSGATSIVAEIKRGGVALIRVSDNGCGMDSEDLPVAIKRHATSKIREREDLDGIITLGFRGEALAAISSVSRVTIITKTQEADCGSMLTSEGGKIVDCGAEQNADMLREMISMDEGAAYLGECALVPYSSPIRKSGCICLTTENMLSNRSVLSLTSSWPTRFCM